MVRLLPLRQYWESQPGAGVLLCLWALSVCGLWYGGCLGDLGPFAET